MDDRSSVATYGIREVLLMRCQLRAHLCPFVPT